MLEGKTKEQESQETGESDSSCGKSEKPVCLRQNETKWNIWPEKPALTFVSQFNQNQRGKEQTWHWSQLEKWGCWVGGKGHWPL